VTAAAALDPYTLVLLRRATAAPVLDDDELDALQERHVAFQRRMRESGFQVLAGPFEGHPDPSWRGIALYRTGLDETRRLVADDPSVQAGRLTVEAWTWWIPLGILPPP
jgi:hypothetical protein